MCTFMYVLYTNHTCTSYKLKFSRLEITKVSVIDDGSMLVHAKHSKLAIGIDVRRDAVPALHLDQARRAKVPVGMALKAVETHKCRVTHGPDLAMDPACWFVRIDERHTYLRLGLSIHCV